MPVMRVSEDFDRIVKERKRKRDRENALFGRHRNITTSDITKDLAKEIKRLEKKEKYMLKGL